MSTEMMIKFQLIDASVFNKVISGFKSLNLPIGVDIAHREEKMSQLVQLTMIYGEVSKFAYKYDYSPSLRYNGIRSYMKIVLSYFSQLNKVIEVLKQHHFITNEKEMKNLNILLGQIVIYTGMGKYIKKIHANWTNGHPGFNEQFYPEAVESLVESFKELDFESVSNYYNLTFAAHWLPKWVREIILLATRIGYITANPLEKSLTGVFSNRKLGHFWADLCLNKNMDTSIAEQEKAEKGWLYKTYLSVSNFLMKDISYVTLDQRQSSYFINSMSKSIDIITSDSPTINRKAVNCVLIEPPNYTREKLIVHIHGGAFIMMSAKTLIPINRRLAKETNAAVLSIDYTLSPQAKYPMALQECLDVYLNVISSKSILGFVPEKVVFVGESAGGHLATSLAIVIAELRFLQKSLGHQLTPLPHALCPVFPAVSSCIGHFFPSRVLMETVLLPNCPYFIFNAYAGPLDEKKYLQEHQNEMWYKDEQLLRQVINQINWRLDDPFFHFVSYKHFDRLKDVSLFITVGEFDPLIDDSIYLAKRWRGNVSLDVAPGMPHAYPAFEFFAPKSYTGSQLIRQRIKEAFEN